MDGWIDIEDELPMWSGYYECLTKYEEGTQLTFFYETDYTFGRRGVTHWRYK